MIQRSSLRFTRCAFAAMAACGLFAAHSASAQVHLTDLDVVGTDANGNYVAASDWHTKALASNAWSLFLINGTDPNGTILNPVQSSSGINIALNTGTYTFTALNADANSTPDYGINLAFEGATTPNISAFAPLVNGQTVGLNAVPSTSTTRLDDAYIPAPGALSFQDGHYEVTLTDFTFKKLPGFNRVSSYSATGGSPDDVSQFTLQVTDLNAVPENSALFSFAGLALLGGMTILRRRVRKSA